MTTETWPVIVPNLVWNDLKRRPLDPLDVVTLKERVGPLLRRLRQTGGITDDSFRVMTSVPECLGLIEDRLMALFVPRRIKRRWRWVWPWLRDRREILILWMTVLPHREDAAC